MAKNLLSIVYKLTVVEREWVAYLFNLRREPWCVERTDIALCSYEKLLEMVEEMLRSNDYQNYVTPGKNKLTNQQRQVIVDLYNKLQAHRHAIDHPGRVGYPQPKTTPQ